MCWLIVPFSLIIFVITYFLFSPIVFELDTNKDRFEIRLWHLAKANLIFEEQPWVRLRVVGLNYKIDLLKAFREKSHRKKKKAKKGMGKFSFQKIAHKSNALIRSFHVSKFYCDLDSGNFLLNSWLYPALHLVDPNHERWNVNFMGRTTISLIVKNNLLRLARAILK